MKTQEELQHELCKQTSDVEEAVLKLEKAKMILSLWIQEYGFNVRPDPRAATMYGTSPKSCEETEAGEQSFKWFYEYNRIFNLIDIVHDYVYESKKILKKAANGEKNE